ncbi:hypothetical protein BH09VER1_BH09VER1_14410 [soil metagenome]
MALTVTVETLGKTVVVQIAGRLDAHGAAEAEERLMDLECRTWMVLELSGMDYVSSAGIRIFVSLHKKLNAQGGKLAVAALQPYCREVLRVSGLDKHFPIFASVAEVLAETGEVADRQIKPCGKFVFHEGSDEPGGLEVLGNIEDVLAARISAEMVKAKKFSSKAYSLGLGGLGPSVESVMPYLGEMMTIGGTMVWLPTDGNDSPDFLVPQQDSDAVVIRTGFNVSIAGPFNEYVEFEASSPQGATLSEIYRGLFDLAKARRPDYRGALALAMRAEMGAVYGCGVVKSPVSGHAPENGKWITDPENYGKWFEVDSTARLHDVTGLICSIGLDLNEDLSVFDARNLGATFYLNPGNLSGEKERLHSHGVFFNPFPLGEKPWNLEREIQSVVEGGEFVDMRHLFDTTTIQWALIGVTYVQDFWPDKADDGDWAV